MTVVRKLLSVDWASELKGIYEYHVLRHLRTVPPRQLVMDVTYRCNSRCVMCNIWKPGKKPELTLEQFDQILSAPLLNGIERLMISGGEPTLRDDLPDLIALSIKHMPSLRTLSFITNGLWPERVLSTCEVIARLCVARGIHLSISVSLDGLGQIHNSMRGIPEAFAKTTRTIAELRGLQERYEFYLGVGCVVCHANLHQLGDFRSWCMEHNLPCGFQLVGFHDTYVDNLAQQQVLDFSEDDLPALYALMEELAAERSLRNWMAYYWADMLHMYRDGRERQSPCPFLVDSFVLDACGNMRICETADNVGNCLTDGSCSDLYYGSKAATMRQAMARRECLTCNSGCLVPVGLRRQGFNYMRFLLSRT